MSPELPNIVKIGTQSLLQEVSRIPKSWFYHSLGDFWTFGSPGNSFIG
jgi:hypothetical protein